MIYEASSFCTLASPVLPSALDSHAEHTEVSQSPALSVRDAVRMFPFDGALTTPYSIIFILNCREPFPLEHNSYTIAEDSSF